MNTKYIFVVGGVMSGVGKGITAASIGKILQSKGFRVSAVKIDPYINVDAGTMNPTEHGEVFVTEDGDETDQDIGNYERFLDQDILSTHYMTTGRVYLSVIEKERNLEYGGKCVEVVPHIPMEVISRIKKAAEISKADFLIVEIGGTIGEYQNILFLEAGRMMKSEFPQDVIFIMVSYLPVPSNVGEMKTKPTQYAARTLNSAGILADFIVCRGEHSLDAPRKQKISTFCNVGVDRVISAPDVDSIYRVPINFEEDDLGNKILSSFGMKPRSKDLKQWRKLLADIDDAKNEIKIGIVGKYFETGDFVLSDSYISVIEAVKHACWHLHRKPKIDWLDSGGYEKDSEKLSELSGYNGIIVPGGFGSRGVQGKIRAIEYARINNIPYFGLCYGMQLATIEFARNVAGIKDANTAEIDDAADHPVIHIMPTQRKYMAEKKYGGTMRLGAYECILKKGSLAEAAYGRKQISERHRHRYEFNNAYRERLCEKGLVLSGLSPDETLVEIIELPVHVHPFFVGVQFHPEFKSRPLHPHPLFAKFIEVACDSLRRSGVQRSQNA